MPRPRLPYVQRETSRHGVVVYYFRRGDGPRIRLRGDYGSDDFRAAYALAYSGRMLPPTAVAQVLSVGWLLARYRESAAWKILAPGTRSKREAILRALPAAAPISAITRKAIIAGLDRRAATPHAANQFLKTLAGLFKWAVYAEHVKVNPVIGVTKLAAKTEGHHVWTDDECARFEARYSVGTRERLAFDLLLYTGLRRGDAIRVGPEHVRDGVLRFRTEKGAVQVSVPILEPLARSLVAAQGVTFIATERGQPYKAGAFGDWFRAAARTAGCPGSAHGLRKSSATRMALAGASTDQLKASYGWKTNDMPEHYTRSANRETLARDGMAKLGKSR